MIDSNEYFRQVVAYVHLNPVAAGTVDDPAEYRFSGHREIAGVCWPYIVNRSAVLHGFGASDVRATADDYLHWVRSVAEARWANAGVSELPWWTQTHHDDEIADADRHPGATTFDGLRLAEERAELGLGEFARRFEAVSGHALDDLASRFRSADHVRGRIELSTLAVCRYGLKVRNIAALTNKHRNSVTKWLNKGLRGERADPDFKKRLDNLDVRISLSG